MTFHRWNYSSMHNLYELSWPILLFNTQTKLDGGIEGKIHVVDPK